MEFEFDDQKSESNKEKHGINFHEAQGLWEDLDLLEVSVQSVGEERYLVIGKLGGKHWSAVITYRGDRIRIISVRRARKEEVAFYENQSEGF